MVLQQRAVCNAKTTPSQIDSGKPHPIGRPRKSGQVMDFAAPRPGGSGRAARTGLGGGERAKEFVEVFLFFFIVSVKTLR